MVLWRAGLSAASRADSLGLGSCAALAEGSIVEGHAVRRVADVAGAVLHAHRPHGPAARRIRLACLARAGTHARRLLRIVMSALRHGNLQDRVGRSAVA